MRIVRFSRRKQVSCGILEDNSIRVLGAYPSGKLKITPEKVRLSRIRLETPVVPSKIVLVGLNYRDHARELGMAIPREPVIFLKPCTSLIGPGQSIVYPAGVGRLDYEAELALVIKKTARNVTRSNAPSFVLGFTCLNDVTARDVQKKDVQWTRAKSFDTFCPVGPWVETALIPHDLRISCRLNGRLKQSSSTSNLIFPVDYLVSFVSRVMTLYPGDIISTGTPPGVGPMRPGDTVEVEIEGVGVLRNSVVRSSLD